MSSMEGVDWPGNGTRPEDELCAACGYSCGDHLALSGGCPGNSIFTPSGRYKEEELQIPAGPMTSAQFSGLVRFVDDQYDPAKRFSAPVIGSLCRQWMAAHDYVVLSREAVKGLVQESDRMAHEVMRHQAGESYDVGYMHGSAVADWHSGMQGRIQFIRRCDLINDVTCTGGTRDHSGPGVSLIIEVDGVWDGIACCDQPRHLAKAAVYALEMRSERARCERCHGDRTADCARCGYVSRTASLPMVTVSADDLFDVLGLVDETGASRHDRDAVARLWAVVNQSEISAPPTSDSGRSEGVPGV